MYYSSGLEYLIGNSYSRAAYTQVTYLSKFTDDKYTLSHTPSIVFESPYMGISPKTAQYSEHNYHVSSSPGHSFTPHIFLNPLRPSARFVDDKNEARAIAEEVLELMTHQKLPKDVSISILQLNEFRLLHSQFGSWNNGILGFSINGSKKMVFVRENNLDELMIVIGHEIGHVLTPTLPNKHDEEAKAFAFSVQWAKTIKEHNVANLGSSVKNTGTKVRSVFLSMLGNRNKFRKICDFRHVKDEIDFNPAKNGLHDIAFSFVDFVIKKGRKPMDLHRDLVKGYTSVFGRIYF